MTQELLALLWFLLPAGLANASPVFAAKIFPRYEAPLDLGLKIGGQRLLGTHKTIRGLCAAIFTGFFAFKAQQYLWIEFETVRNISLYNYSNQNPLFGAVLGEAVIVADAVKSFIKRRLKIQPGEPFVPFDQIDWIIGTILVSIPFVPLTIEWIALSLLIGGVCSMFFHFAGYLLKITDAKI